MSKGLRAVLMDMTFLASNHINCGEGFKGSFSHKDMGFVIESIIIALI